MLCKTIQQEPHQPQRQADGRRKKLKPFDKELKVLELGTGQDKRLPLNGQLFAKKNWVQIKGTVKCV
jgi:hypothetical protein